MTRTTARLRDRRRLVDPVAVVLASVLVVGFPAGVPAAGARGEGAAERDARTVIAELEGALVAAMKDSARPSFRRRYEALAPVITRTYDLPYIGRLVLRASWGGLSEGQRDRFNAAFERLIVSTFAAELGAYHGQQFKFELEKPLRRGRILVRSRLLEGDGDTTQFDYHLRNADGRWRVINVSVDGVSDLTLKRAEYSALIRSDGFDALISRIESQIHRYESGGK